MYLCKRKCTVWQGAITGGFDSNSVELRLACTRKQNVRPHASKHLYDDVLIGKQSDIILRLLAWWWLVPLL